MSDELFEFKRIKYLRGLPTTHESNIKTRVPQTHNSLEVVFYIPVTSYLPQRYGARLIITYPVHGIFFCATIEKVSTRKQIYVVLLHMSK